MLEVTAMMIVMVAADVSGGGDSDGWTSAVDSDDYGDGEYEQSKWWSSPAPQERVQTSH